MPVIVSIEGNIGSGKSTFINYIADTFNSENVVIVPEPVKEWDTIQDTDGKSMLSHFYEDQTRNAFSFQMMAYISRLAGIKQAIENNPKAQLIVTERCLETDRNVFAKMLYHDNKIREIDYQIYEKWFNEFSVQYRPDHYIYIRTNHDVCSDRIKTRSREGEEGLPLEYLKTCGEYHDGWLEDKKKIFICDGNVSKEDGHSKWAKHIEYLLESQSTDDVLTEGHINYII